MTYPTLETPSPRTLRFAFVTTWLSLAIALLALLLAAPLTTEQKVIATAILHNALALAWLSHTGFDRSHRQDSDEPKTPAEAQASAAQRSESAKRDTELPGKTASAVWSTSATLVLAASLAGQLFGTATAWLPLFFNTAALIWTIQLQQRAQLQKKGAELATRLGAITWQCIEIPSQGKPSEESSEYTRPDSPNEPAWLFQTCKGELLVAVGGAMDVSPGGSAYSRAEQRLGLGGRPVLVP